MCYEIPLPVMFCAVQGISHESRTHKTDKQYSVQHTVYYAKYTAYSVQHTAYSVQYTIQGK